MRAPQPGSAVRAAPRASRARARRRCSWRRGGPDAARRIGRVCVRFFVVCVHMLTAAERPPAPLNHSKHSLTASP